MVQGPHSRALRNSGLYHEELGEEEQTVVNILVITGGGWTGSTGSKTSSHISKKNH